MLEAGLLIRRIALAMRRQGGAILAAYDLTTTQGELIYQLSLQDGAEQRTLAELLGITKASLSSVVDGLEERKLVKRWQHPDDARIKQVFLTEEGKALFNQMKNYGQILQERLLKDFSKAETELLVDWLRRLASNLEDL